MSLKKYTETFSIPESDLLEVYERVGQRWEKLRGGRILLTGGTGFIGKWLLDSFLLADRMLGLEAQITIVSRSPKTFMENFPILKCFKNIEWVASDIREFSASNLKPFNYGIHAATDVVGDIDEMDVLDTCISGTKRVLEAMNNRAPSRLLYVSSGAVYGEAHSAVEGFPEEWTGGPNILSCKSAYGEGKRVGELLCALMARKNPMLKTTIARCFAVVGPHLPLDGRFAIGNFIKAAVQAQDIEISGDGTALRSYIYISDLTTWLWIVLLEGNSGHAYNVGGEEVLSIAELATKVKEELRSNINIQILKAPDSSIQRSKYIPDIKKIKTELGVKQTVGLSESIKRTAEWAKGIK